jgi:hypothetical protein
VPVLARIFEQAGMSTVMVTNMPHWAEKVGAPRALGVEMPFGHILGKPHDKDQQTRIIKEGLQVLASACTPGTVVHSEERWPGTEEEAQHDSHPETPPPIAREMGHHIGEFLRGLRRRER